MALVARTTGSAKAVGAVATSARPNSPTECRALVTTIRSAVRANAGQYADNDFKCCSSIGLLGTFEDWCLSLRDDPRDGCKYNGQCKRDWCSGNQCIATYSNRKSCTKGDNFMCTSDKCCNQMNWLFQCTGSWECGSSWDSVTKMCK